MVFLGFNKTNTDIKFELLPFIPKKQKIKFCVADGQKTLKPTLTLSQNHVSIVMFCPGLTEHF